MAIFSPGLAGSSKPLPGVWPRSHVNHYLEPQVTVGCQMGTKGEELSYKDTTVYHPREYCPSPDTTTPHCIVTPLVNRTHLPSLSLHGQSQCVNRPANTNKGAVGQTLLLVIQLLLIQLCQLDLVQVAIGCYPSAVWRI